MAKTKPKAKRRPSNSMEYLLGEILVDRPSDRDMACAETKANWPEGWWGVSDFNDGYIAYFAKESDAYGFRLHLINSIMSGVDTGKRYRGKGKGPEHRKGKGPE